MEVTYSIEYINEVILENIPARSSPNKQIIKKAIEERLTTDPVAFGKPLRYSLKGHRRLRVGNDRIIYRIIEASKVVLIIAIKHPKDLYEEN